MRRKNAKEILADSFRELAEKKNIDKITVADITDNCGYSSATFYRQFKDKYDLIAWDYSRKVEKLMDQLDGKDHLWRDTLLDGARFFEADKEYLANLFLHTSGMDSFFRYMIELHDRHLRECVMRSAGTDSLNEEVGMYIHLYCHGTVALICDWVLGKYRMDAEKAAEIFENSLPSPLKHYLCKENERI